MSLVILAFAFGLLAAPGGGLALARRMSARAWVRWSTISTLTGVLLLEVGLLLVALPTVFRSLGLVGFADLCARMAGHLFPWGGVLGWPAAAGSVALPLAILSGFIGAMKTHRGLCQRAVHAPTVSDMAGVKVVEVAGPEAFALAVPGRQSCVVISSGALATLSESERAAVIRHEVAHLQSRHWVGLALVVGTRRALGWLPIIRRTLQSVRLGIEREADEYAAGALGEGRDAVKTAILKFAGVSVSAATALSFSDSDLIVERLRALGTSGRPSILATGTAGFVVISIAVAALATLSAWAGHAHEVTVLAGLCPV